MSRVRLLFSEAWSSIRMNLSTTFAATMTVLIGMCLLGLFIALGTWVLSWSNHVQKELQVHVYFQSDATPQQEAAVAARLRNDPRVKPGGVEFVSKAEALAQMKKNFKDLTRIPLPSNPLPDSYTVTPLKAAYTPLIGKKVKAAGWSGVDNVRWGSETA
jgi:cell division transport system permease protein